LIGSHAEPVRAEMPLGSALVFDDRVLHRGGGNASDKVRDVAFFSFRRANYSTSTYYESSRTIQRYDHRSLAPSVRREFPGLSRPRGPAAGAGAPAPEPVLADGASGSQMHGSAIDAMVEQMRHGVANVGGEYDSSHRVGETLRRARGAMADFLNCGTDEVVFGPTMTALAYHVARSIRAGGTPGARLRPGDNVVLDPLGHGANVWPWVQLAEACGAEVRWLPVAPTRDGAGRAECLLDSRGEQLSRVIDGRTQLVAVGAASNGTGSVHGVGAVVAQAKRLSGGAAFCFVDAVHYAPHAAVDVTALGCDALACSPYKFFGPHAGALYLRRGLAGALPVDRLDCQENRLASEETYQLSRLELGTQNFESLAGIVAAVEYLAQVGVRFGGAVSDSPRRQQLEVAWQAIEAHERELKECFLEGAARVDGLRILGVCDPRRQVDRTPTFAVAKDGQSAEALTATLCARDIWCTSGNHYAGFWDAHSGGLASNDTGMTRIGFLHYNTLDEVERVLGELRAA